MPRTTQQVRRIVDMASLTSEEQTLQQLAAEHDRLLRERRQLLDLRFREAVLFAKVARDLAEAHDALRAARRAMESVCDTLPGRRSTPAA